MESIAELRRICQADKLQRSRGLTRLNRWVSIYATFVALALGVSANVLTVVSIAAGVCGAVLLAVPGYGANLTGVALLYASFLLDQVDGEVARYHRTTVTGAYLDEIRHIVIYAAPVFAASMQLMVARPSLIMAWAGFAAAIGLIVLRFNTNVHYLLVAKKFIFGPGDEALARATATASDTPVRAPRTEAEEHAPRRRSPQAWLGDAIPAVTYVTTNQVSLLFLFLAYVHVLAFVPNPRLHDALFLGYAAIVVALTVLGLWKMAYRRRVEKDTAGLARTLTGRYVR